MFYWIKISEIVRVNIIRFENVKFNEKHEIHYIIPIVKIKTICLLLKLFLFTIVKLKPDQ